MKTTQKFRLLIQLFGLVLLITLCGLKCEKDFPPGTPEIDKLPPATQIGAEKFGCLVDGKAFIPQKSWADPSPYKQAFYQYLDNVYYFSIGVSNSKDSPLKSIILSSKGIELQEQTYELTDGNILGNFGAEYQVYFFETDDFYYTTSIVKGQITITHFDLINQIVSGTFWFDAINNNGKIVQVREGRFDMHFVL